jgi:hypothetical protein
MVGWVDLIFPGLIVLYCVMQLAGFADDPGLGWHLQTGLLISDSGIPVQDSFLAGPARPWVADQWLADLLFYLLYSGGGWPLLYAVLISVFFSSFLVLYYVLRRADISAVAAVFAVFFSSKVSLLHFIARPTLFGFLFFSCLLFFLYSTSSEEEQRQPVQRCVLLFLLFMLWANLHPTFPLGLLALGLWTITPLLEEGYVSGRFPVGKGLIMRLLPLGVGSLATLVNPYGPTLYSSIIQLGESSYFMRLHEEWRSPDFAELPAQLCQWMLVFIVLMRSAGISREISWRSLALMLVFTVLGLRAVRILPYLSMVLALPFGQALTALLKRVGGVPLVALLDRFSGYGILGTGCTVIGLIGYSLVNGCIPFYSGELGPTTVRFPFAATEFLRSIVGAPINVLAPPRWGGAITFASSGIVKPVADDRNQLVGEGLLQEVYDAFEPGGDWYALAQKTDSSYLFVPRHSSTERWLRQSLSAIYQDASAVIFRVPSRWPQTQCCSYQ